MAKIVINVMPNDAKLGEILLLLKSIGEKMVTQTDIDVIVVQLNKVKTEIMAQIAALQAMIDAGHPVLDLSALQGAVQGLDDLNPDQAP